MNIVIAGAAGFIGQHLIESIAPNHHIIALSRRSRSSNNKNVEWKQADLYSLHSSVEALRNADIAVYLVHSMLPATKLFQGQFQDTDLLLADNFSKACLKNSVKQIIYVGGLIPKGPSSQHLQSRKEVEEVLHSTGIPCTILRSGLVVGNGGSSFEILKNLVFNLPIMILPKWAKSKTQAIYIDDLINVIQNTIDNINYYNKTIDVVNGEDLTYRQLIEQTAQYLEKRIVKLSIPINYLKLSKRWVTLFGQAPYELVSPLIDSLQCDLPQVSIPKELAPLIKHKTYASMLQNIPKMKTIKSNQSENKSAKTFGANTVRSIQRLSQTTLTEKEISEEYFNWLPKKLNGYIQAKKEKDCISFYIYGLSKPLLTLQHVTENEQIQRVKFNIVGGLLSKTTDTGWLEFRVVANGKFVLASVNEFIPSLPWFIYKYGQAIVHLYIMKQFSEHLRVSPMRYHH